MTWLLCWKMVLATVTIVVAINAVAIAAKTTRDAIHHWKAPRG